VRITIANDAPAGDRQLVLLKDAGATEIPTVVLFSVSSNTPMAFINSVVPFGGIRSTNVNVTLTGSGLAGIDGLKFYGSSGQDSGITASAVTPSGDGTSLTATINIGAGAQLGGTQSCGNHAGTGQDRQRQIYGLCRG